MNTPERVEPADVLFRVQRGLSAYVSYLAACEMNQAFSEYVLYEPILRILTARGYAVECECVCPGVKQPKTGDRKRIDFLARGHGVAFALEVKWAKSNRLSVKRDLGKLEAVATTNSDISALLCVFGRKSQIEALAFNDFRLSERGSPVYADLAKTRYGCRIYELHSTKTKASNKT